MSFHGNKDNVFLFNPPPLAPFWFSFCCLNWESGSIMSGQCFFLLFLMRSHFVGILLGPPCYSLGSLPLFFFFFGLNLCSVLPCVSGPSSPRRSPLRLLRVCLSVFQSVLLSLSSLLQLPRLLALLGFSASWSLSRVSVPVSASAPP